MRAKEVGERVRQVREKLELTQSEFAKLLGVTRISVARYEAGRVPRLSLLRHMARLGGVNVGWILQEMPDREGSRRGNGRESYRAVPEAATSLLIFLKSEMVGISRLPKGRRKQYEERLGELLARVKQDLLHYRRLLEAGRRPRRTPTRQATKQRRTL